MKRDYDGLLDGEEVTVVYKEDTKARSFAYIQDGKSKNNQASYIAYYTRTSFLEKQDSDGDGIPDGIDPEKLIYNITDRTLGLVAGLAYSNLEQHKGKKISSILTGKPLKNISTDDILELSPLVTQEQENLGISMV